MARMARRLALLLAAGAASSLCTCGASSSSSSSWSSASGLQMCGARDETALTSDCLGLCYDGRPCIAYASASAVVGSEDDEQEPTACEATTFSACVNASRAGCALECFTNGPDDFVAHDAVGFSSYTFLVPFAGAEADAAAQENDTDVLPSKTNAVLKRVEPLSLLAVTTKAAILGGSSVEYAVARGQTAEMYLADGFLAANTQLQEITLANLALRSIARGSLPTSSVTDLTLANCLLSTTYPRDLTSMAALARLDLSQNLFTDFPSSLSLPALQELNLSANELTSFRGDLPLLESLDLSENQLTGIPSSVFELPRLERLYLRANPFATLILSESQLAFLENLSVLSTDSLGDVSHCSSPSSSSDDALGSSAGTSLQLVRVHDVSVCALVSTSSLDGSETSVTSTDEASPSSNTAIVAGSAIGGAVVLLALVAGLVMFVRRHSRRRRPHSKLTAALAEDALDAALCPPPPASTAESEKAVERALLSAHGLLEWRVDASDIHWMTDEFARGSRHIVDLAVFQHRFRHDGRFRRELFPGAIAVKRLRVDERDDPRARDRLLADAAVLSRVRHPQILALLGVRYSRALGVQALVEFMEGGTLRGWLSGLLDAGESSAWTPIKAQLALDVADALAFAHTRAPPLVHARLRSDKVFLTGDARAKLGDWRAYEPSGSGGGGGDQGDGMGTVLLPRSGGQPGERWMAPEVLAGSAAHSPASDVFALGVLLSELDTHRPPYEGGGELVAHGGAVSVLVASGRLRPAFSAGADGLPRALRAVAQRCLALDPRARPAALEVARVFRAAAEREA